MRLARRHLVLACALLAGGLLALPARAAADTATAGVPTGGTAAPGGGTAAPGGGTTTPPDGGSTSCRLHTSLQSPTSTLRPSSAPNGFGRRPFFLKPR